MAGDYKWRLSTGGDVGTAANWSPFTNGSPGTTPPGSADEAEFANLGGTITGNITVFEWVIDSGAGLYTFAGDTTATFFSVSASASLTGIWTQNGASEIDIAAGTFTMGSTAQLISHNSAANALDLVVDGALVANGGTIAAAAIIGIGNTGTGTLSANSGATISAASIELANQAGASGTLDLSGGATASLSRFLVIGAATGGAGAAVDINAATLTDQDQVQVGAQSSGMLTVEGGGLLSTSASLTQPFLVVGGAGGTGIVDIKDAGSELNAGKNLIEIGAGGAGTVTVESAATLFAGGLDVGIGSAGTLDIESGATLTSKGAGLALQSSSHVPGTATVLLDAAQWLSSSQIQVGAGPGGTAELQIEDGATLQATATLAATVPFLVVDENVAGHASVDVGGATTVLNAGSNSVIIGDAGFGALTVHDGAVLDAGNAGQNAAFVLGELSGSAGTATLTGVTSRIDVNGGAVIGESGAGTLAVGGTVSVSGNLDLAVNKSASGTVDVSGTGSDLSVTGQIVIGGAATAGGIGAMTLASGGTLTAGSLAMFAGGTLTIDGTSGAEIGTAGTGVAGALVVDAGVTAFGSGEIAAAVVNHGSVLAQSGTLDITGLAAGDGVYEIASGATLDLGDPGDVRIQFANTTGMAILGAASGTASLSLFSGHDTLRIVGIGAGAGITYSGNTATVAAAGGSWTFGIGSLAHDFQVSNDGNDALVVACFVEGTLIGTPAGEVPVERLSAGNPVLTLRGEARRIVWIGKGSVLATRGRRTAATPVIVHKGALSENVPHHDLRVTKGHSLFVNDMLIPVEFLVNHRSIEWDDRAQEVTVYHIELETHDVLLANGAPAETYRDDGNRWLFQNANSGWDLPPQEPCAPVLTGGPIVDAVWRQLLEHAGPRRSMRLTDDPDLHLLVDGKRIDAIERRDDMRVFRLRVRPRSVRIRSRASVPQELGIARDDRSLGVTVRQIVLAEPGRRSVIEADAASLVDGYHAFEADNGTRWTDGDAAVPADLFAGMNSPGMLLLRLGGSTQYLDCGTSVLAA